MIIAANDSLARHLRMAALDQSRSVRTEYSNTILSLRQWLVEVWQTSLPSKQLIDATQAKWILGKILQDIGNDEHMLYLDRAAAGIYYAYNQSLHYQLDLDSEAFAVDSEYVLFTSCIEQFHQYQDSHGLITEEQLYSAIMDTSSSLVDLPYTELVFKGFLEFTPHQQTFINWLAQQGITANIDSIMVDRSLSTITYEQFDDELNALGTDIAQYLQANQSSPVRIGIAVPDIEKYQNSLQLVLTRFLAPRNNFSSESSNALWDFTHGLRFSESPLYILINTILSLCSRSIDSEIVSRYLLNRMVASDEFDARAKLDYKLRKLGATSISLHTLLKETAINSLEQTHDQIQSVIEFRDDSQSTAGLSVWIGRLNELLDKLNVFDNLGYSQHTSSSVSAWHKITQQITALEKSTGTCRLSLFMKMVQDFSFFHRYPQPLMHLPPIDIRSYQDMVGCEYDRVYVVDFSQQVLPVPVQLNNWIPAHLQAEHNMGNAQSSHNLFIAEHMFQYLQKSGKEVIISCSYIDQTGQEQLPSPLLVSPTHAGDLTDTQSANDRLDRESALDPIPHVGTEELSLLKGTVALLRDLKQSPYYAFLIHRLKCESFPEKGGFLKATDQGNLLHDALFRFWKEIGSSAALAQMDSEVLEDFVERCIKESIDDAKNYQLTYSPILKQLETERLVQLLIEWLEVEKCRDPFEVIYTEQALQIKLNQLTFNLKVDRIDRVLSDDRLFSIDYKSGGDPYLYNLASRNQDPQIPLYTLAVENELGKTNGGAIALVTEGSTKLVGGTTPEHLNTKIPLVKPMSDWTQSVNRWEFESHTEIGKFLNGIDSYGLDRPYRFYEFLLPLG